MVSCMLNSIYVLSPVQGSTREKVYEEEKVLRKKLFFSPFYDGTSILSEDSSHSVAKEGLLLE